MCSLIKRIKGCPKKTLTKETSKFCSKLIMPYAYVYPLPDLLVVMNGKLLRNMWWDPLGEVFVITAIVNK
jgi:hypothetical protein